MRGGVTQTEKIHNHKCSGKVRSRYVIRWLTISGIVVLAALIVTYLREIPPDKSLSVVERALGSEAPRERARGPLIVSPDNPRYFTDGSGKAILLVGSHTWSNFIDNGFEDPPRPFDYEAYLDFLVASNHNFFKLWSWEQAKWGPQVLADDYFYYPGPPYQRTGPGMAKDGKPKFNLDLFDEKYFERLRSRVRRAGERGIYVAIMLFNGWSTDNLHSGLSNPWRGHPFNRANNVNGVDGDLNKDGNGDETYQLLIPEVTAYQERYVTKVVQTVNDLDNVLFEISNESFENSKEWQYHMIRFIRNLEAKLPKRHPIGMTSYVGLRKPTNPDLFESPADWVAPNRGVNDEYATAPPATNGEKVVILDTDHIWGIGGSREWAWKGFLRGYNLLFMDGYDGTAVGSGAPADFDIRRVSWKTAVKKVLGFYHPKEGWNPNAEEWVSLRSNLGNIRWFSTRVDLSRMKPRGKLSSTGYCLAGVDGNSADYLVYRPQQSGEITVDLSTCSGTHEIEWFNPRNGQLLAGGQRQGGRIQSLMPPFEGDAVVYIHSSQCAKDG